MGGDGEERGEGVMVRRRGWRGDGKEERGKGMCVGGLMWHTLLSLFLYTKFVNSRNFNKHVR